MINIWNDHEILKHFQYLQKEHIALRTNKYQIDGEFLKHKTILHERIYVQPFFIKSDLLGNFETVSHYEMIKQMKEKKYIHFKAPNGYGKTMFQKNILLRLSDVGDNHYKRHLGDDIVPIVLGYDKDKPDLKFPHSIGGDISLKKLELLDKNCQLLVILNIERQFRKRKESSYFNNLLLSKFPNSIKLIFSKDLNSNVTDLMICPKYQFVESDIENSSSKMIAEFTSKYGHCFK